MATATWEQASRCPGCGEQGSEILSSPTRGGGQIKTLVCMNERCKYWEPAYMVGQKGKGFRWIVQVDVDGTIPVRDAKGPKQFELPGWAKKQATRDIDEAEQIEKSGEGEIRS
jgi:hypothetical protein